MVSAEGQSCPLQDEGHSHAKDIACHIILCSSRAGQLLDYGCNMQMIVRYTITEMSVIPARTVLSLNKANILKHIALSFTVRQKQAYKFGGEKIKKRSMSISANCG